MLLLANTTSPYARIARAALIEKGMDDALELRLINPWADEGGLLALNPAGRVPTLVPDGGPPLTESLLIVLWLERRRPVPSLLDGDLDRVLSQAGRAMGVIDAMVHTVIGVLRTDPAWAGTPVGLRRRRTVVEGLRALDADPPDPPAAAGGTPSLAVLTAVVALDYLRLRFGAEPWVEALPRLDALRAAVTERPAYALTVPRL